MKYFILSLCSLLMFSCSAPAKEDSRKSVKMRIIQIYPPKHFSVDLENVVTGEKWFNVYVSKRCSNWKSIPANTELIMIEYSYSDGHRKYRELDGHEIYRKYCN